MFYENYFISSSFLSLVGTELEARISRSMSRISNTALSTLRRWTARMMYSTRISARTTREGTRIQPRSWLMIVELISPLRLPDESDCCKEVSWSMSSVYNKVLVLLQTVLRANLLHVDTVYEVREPVGVQKAHRHARARAADAVQHQLGVARNIFELFGDTTHDYLWRYVQSPGNVAFRKFKWFAYVNNYSIHTTNVNQLQ